MLISLLSLYNLLLGFVLDLCYIQNLLFMLTLQNH